MPCAEAQKTKACAEAQTIRNRVFVRVCTGAQRAASVAKILALLMERYGQLFGEAETPDSDDSAENELRRHRLGFYERNGFRIADYECALFGVHFKCLYAGPLTDDREVEDLHRSVYASYFSPAHMEQFIQLPLRPGEEIHPAPQWVEEDEEQFFT